MTRKPSFKETAQAGYEAWAVSMGWSIAGVPLPFWEHLTAREQDAWREASHAVFRQGWLDDVRRR